MKWLVGLLLLANALLLGYFQLVVPSRGDVPVAHDIEPSKIKLLSEDELAAMVKPKPAPPVAPSLAMTALPQHCYAWGSFAEADAARAKQALDELALDATVRQRAPADAIRYWVYIPPLKTPEAAQAKAGELKRMGIEESYIVKESQWRNAISLGLFRDETLATKFLEDLRARGVRSAVKGQRNHEGELADYLIKNVTPTQLDELNKRNQEFPGSELRPADCQ